MNLHGLYRLVRESRYDLYQEVTETTTTNHMPLNRIDLVSAVYAYYYDGDKQGAIDLLMDYTTPGDKDREEYTTAVVMRMFASLSRRDEAIYKLEKLIALHNTQ